MKLSIAFFLICIANYNFSQTKLIDIETQQAVSSVHVINDLGKIIDVSDKNGRVNIEKIRSLKFKNITFHHIGYNDYRILVDSLDLIKVVYLVPKVTQLKEFVISDKEPLYMKITGYYRTFTARNDVPIIYSDGMISYYVPLKKRNKKIKKSVDQYRSFINPEERELMEKTPAGKLFFKFSPARPYLSKSIINSNLTVTDNTIFRNSDSIGSINRNDKNQSIKVLLDYLAPDTVRIDTSQFISMVIKQIKSQYSKVFEDSLGLKDLRYQMHVDQKEIINLKTNEVVSITMFSELDVVEISYIYSKKEIIKSHSYGNFQSYYTSNYWKKWEGTSFIDKLLHKILIEQPIKKID